MSADGSARADGEAQRPRVPLPSASMPVDGVTPDADRRVTGSLPLLVPHWPVASRVRALVTTREGGLSSGPFGLAGGQPGGLNLGEHVGDDPDAVRGNRARLAAVLPAPVNWLHQVHGTRVFRATAGIATDPPPEADAAVTAQAGVVLAVMTADCLPILLADAQGTVVGIAHAGWRGLAAGVAEATVDAMRGWLPPARPLVAWLGPAIGPGAFEVGEEVRAAFCDVDAAASEAFVPAAGGGKWLADLYRLARLRLARCGVEAVHGGGRCTVSDPQRFYSHRRDGRSGRMVSLIWIDR